MQITFRCDPALVDLLPRPVPAKQALPAWLREMAPKGFSDVHGRDVRTVKQCPPFVDAMSHGFVIPLPCDVQVDRGVFSWDWDLPPLSMEAHPRAPLSFHPPAQLRGTPFDNGQSAIKFNSFWTIEVEPGWSLFATHPVNRRDLPFQLLSGIVDADRFTEAGINFPALWTEPDFVGVLPKGTPVAQCFVVPRVEMTLSCEPFSAEQVAHYDTLASEILSTPGVYRRRFRVKRGG